mmetsp:Transcript_23977/g.54648  ORF Transcript_23977/g.54648 Transcript_23977/m.54648 type:complete len:225 (+) Transcript_23977:302-976(+)
MSSHRGAVPCVRLCEGSIHFSHVLGEGLNLLSSPTVKSPLLSVSKVSKELMISSTTSRLTKERVTSTKRMNSGKLTFPFPSDPSISCKSFWAETSSFLLSLLFLLAWASSVTKFRVAPAPTSIHTDANTLPRVVRGNLSPKPTVDIVITAMYKLSTHVFSSSVENAKKTVPDSTQTKNTPPELNSFAASSVQPALPRTRPMCFLGPVALSSMAAASLIKFLTES